ncbi:MAG: hypothetical protein KDE63_07285 [Novosphingobium sp.]|nr:hypothetical protein [Novosphingobium sp.]
MTPQGKVCADIGTEGRTGARAQLLLNTLMHLQCNQTFMATLAQRHIPFGRFDVARVNRPRQNIVNLLVADRAAPVLRKENLRFQKAQHLTLRGKPARGKAFQRLLDQ